MYRSQAAVMGTSAYELERLGALPEFPDLPQEQHTPELAAPPSEGVRTRVRARARARDAQRQSVSKFAMLGAIVVAAMLLMVVLSHLQLAVISHEMVELEGQLAELTEEAIQLQVAYEIAFNQAHVEHFAREELGMVDASASQVFHIGAVLGDTAQILEVPDDRDHGVLAHLANLFGSLREYFSFLS